VVDVDEPVDADRLYALRATLAAHASELGAAQERVDHLLIVASELATNAIRHGGGTGRLRMWHRDGILYCQVSDDGPGIANPTVVGNTPPDPGRSDGGRGLWICRNLADELIIEAGEDGRGATVTAVMLGLDESARAQRP
jgi:anti-sigma regulatory factor (Ser/Thr protein kinase)